jgi:hypothetical protein
VQQSTGWSWTSPAGRAVRTTVAISVWLGGIVAMYATIAFAGSRGNVFSDGFVSVVLLVAATAAVGSFSVTRLVARAIPAHRPTYGWLAVVTWIVGTLGIPAYAIGIPLLPYAVAVTVLWATAQREPRRTRKRRTAPPVWLTRLNGDDPLL